MAKAIQISGDYQEVFVEDFRIIETIMDGQKAFKFSIIPYGLYTVKGKFK